MEQVLQSLKFLENTQVDFLPRQKFVALASPEELLNNSAGGIHVPLKIQLRIKKSRAHIYKILEEKCRGERGHTIVI